VGGVSGRPTREAGRSDPFERPSSRRWKAPGPPESVTLRGGAKESGSWPVCTSFVEVSSSAGGHTGDSRCPEDAEEGNVVSIRHQAHAPSTRPTRHRVLRGHVLHSVLGSVHVDRHYTSESQGNEGGAFEWVSRSGKLAQARGTGTGACTNGRKRGSPRVTASARKVVRDASEPEGDRGLRPSEVRELGSQCPYVAVKAVAEVTRRCSVSNKLTRSAPKRATVRVNGGLARSDHRR